MKTKNNLIDQMEIVKDNKLYAVNIHLKSGQIVHLEHLEKGKKDAYVNYVRTGTEKMLIETSRQVWRILPDDVERLEVKAYNSQQANGVYPFMRFLMARSRMETSTFTRFITFFIILFIVSIGVQMGIAIAEKDPFSILLSPSLFIPYLEGAASFFKKGAMILVFIMFVLNVLDFILKPTEEFFILDDDRSILEGTKLLHVIITLSCLVVSMLFSGYLFNILGKIIG